MKIHSICIAKNEVDIIAQTLTKATEWCDYTYVVDNGSNDGTWEKILDIAKKYPQVIAHKQDNRTFYNGMRGEVFSDFRHNIQPGNWLCRLDADELYIDNPRIFLSEVPNRYQAVWGASFQYYFTDKDLELYRQHPSYYSDDVLVEKKCRYYLNNWSENRFIRYDQKMVWDKDCGWPYFGAIYPKRIRLKHYQYRSPQQIQNRVIARLQAREEGSSSFLHEAQALSNSEKATPFYLSSTEHKDDIWKNRIVNASELNYDLNNNDYSMREDLMPPVPKTYFPNIENRLRYFKKYKKLYLKSCLNNCYFDIF